MVPIQKNSVLGHNRLVHGKGLHVEFIGNWPHGILGVLQHYPPEDMASGQSALAARYSHD